MGGEMSSDYIICETDDCNKNAALVIVYGCLEGHLGDTILCATHYAYLVKQLPATVCGDGHPIDEMTLKVASTSRITMSAARGVLLRPRQQAQMKRRIRGLSGAWNTIGSNTLPMRTGFPISNWKDVDKVKKEMAVLSVKTNQAKKDIEKLKKEIEKDSKWNRILRNAQGKT